MRRSPSLGKGRTFGPAANRKKIPVWVREAVVARSGGHCEAAVNGDCRLKGEHLHHKLMRSAGGKHTQENLINVCAPCHRQIHANPAASYAKGYLIRRAV
jgi:5-methylcytosine-specific restriction endonuclease McrA